MSVDRVCQGEGIVIPERDAVDLLIQLADFNPRLVLRTLEQVKVEGGVLSKQILKSPVITDALFVQSGKSAEIEGEVENE